MTKVREDFKELEQGACGDNSKEGQEACKSDREKIDATANNGVVHGSEGAN